MRAILQRVTQASVKVSEKEISRIGKGYLILICAMEGDSEMDGMNLASKIANIRLFGGEDGKINDRSILEIGGGILVVSQFTLAGDLSKGRRPDYTAAASPLLAQSLYQGFVASLRSAGIADVQTGEFGALMQVTLTNDGPVTLLLSSSTSTHEA